MNDRIEVRYRIRSDAKTIAARAAAIAVEQSVEMPVAAIDDAFVLGETVGRVEDIADLGAGQFEVRLSLAVSTTGLAAGQLINMLFGNSSIQSDVELWDADFSPDFAAAFGGPNFGLAGLRARVGASRRALTCSALKPQGLPPAKLAELAGRMTAGGIDYIKDDHGLADQRYSRFAERVPAIAEAVAAASAKTGIATRYLPNVSGSLDAMREQVALARGCGLDGVLIEPLIAGLDQFLALKKENPDLAFMTHPALAGIARIAPAFLLGKLLRLLGADATVFPNHGGRFGYTPEECHRLARFALDGTALRSCVPVPAGGMTLERVPELLDFYGNDVMLLIGGNLLAAREQIPTETARIAEAVRRAAGETQQ
jgi:ribulose-bisphosphate carboxylase large chain